ncbi:hypothetical protein J6590_084013 [Homalodisca vitripennis]|nr:hypothetical protein J6590_084013 [Homalodisca vitripennis]
MPVLGMAGGAMPFGKMPVLGMAGGAMPFGKMPVLEVDGKQLSQSVAICRYLGNLAGLAGENLWENTQIDVMADTLTDVRLPISAFIWEPNEELRKAKKDTYIKETLPFYMEKLDAIVKENDGYLANKKLSWVDFLFATITEFVSYATDVPDATADYPNLHALKEKIFDLPQIKKWVEKRPSTAF